MVGIYCEPFWAWGRGGKRAFGVMIHEASDSAGTREA